ncbi:hypothetical protein [Candidatus Viridilinea mediisalina]|uniref:Glycosyltransferase RgtA/B/C/D-like domain-containing protein n=1 Tax=Candidatus Viridilinea mediisalina TaxID=2024553 RepID=A0A2A6RLJ5_9CHLR|nr:hypothetical protein [Candidatus Viridilinea mediisalina]PDW03728.1 hypothetical protein CJ255_07420 [Candidatus Viridilinea mediisalina]
MVREERQHPEALRPALAGPEGIAQQRWRSVALHTGVILLYTLCAILISWPMVRYFTTGIIGAEHGVDAFQGTWNLWWVATALSSGRLPFFTNILYYPTGVDLFWQTSQVAHGITALPITLLLGPLAGFNWTVLLSFVLSGYVTFLFAREVTGHTLGSLLGGMVFAFSPYHVQRMVDGPVEVTAIHWVPLYLFALYTLLERPTWWRSLLCGLLLVWVGLGGWYYGLFCVMTTGLAAAVWLFVPGPGQPWRWPDRQAWMRAIWGGTPAIWWLILIAPQLQGLMSEPDKLWDLREIHALRSADLLDFFLPNPLHPLWGEAIWAAREQRYPGAVIWNVALGWVGIAVGVLGAVTAWPLVRRWVALIGLTLLLAMGPTLRIAGYDTGLPLPFMLLQDIPGIRSGQRPSHIMVIASVLLAILVAYGFAWLSRRMTARAAGGLAAGLIALLLAFDAYAGPMLIQQREVHPFYHTLGPAPFDAEGNPRGAVMPLPLYIQVNRSENLTTQIVHRWPILGGYLARPPAYTFSRYAPGLREIEGYPLVANDIVNPGWPLLGQQSFAAYDVRYVALDLTVGREEYFARVRATAEALGFGPPIVADERLEVYSVPDTWPVGPLGYLGPGWQGLEEEGAYRWRWIGEQAEIRLFNPLEQAHLATITLRMISHETPRPLAFQLHGSDAGQLLIEAHQPTSHQIRLLVPPGHHTVTLEAPATPDPARSDEAISIRFFALDVRFQELVGVDLTPSP